jgi:hypothetical protein
MKLIFENWNKWLNEEEEQEETPSFEMVNFVRDRIKEYYDHEGQGGQDWRAWLRKEDPGTYPDARAAVHGYWPLKKRIYDILDKIEVNVEADTKSKYLPTPDPYGAIEILQKDLQNKNVIQHLFFQAIDNNIENSNFCDVNVCPETATELFSDRLRSAVGDDLATETIYRELRILRMRQGVNMQEMTPVDLKRIRQFGGKEGHPYYAPNLRAALIRMKKMGKTDDIILKNLNNIAMRQTKTDTRIA